MCDKKCIYCIARRVSGTRALLSSLTRLPMTTMAKIGGCGFLLRHNHVPSRASNQTILSMVFPSNRKASLWCARLARNTLDRSHLVGATTTTRFALTTPIESSGQCPFDFARLQLIDSGSSLHTNYSRCCGTAQGSLPENHCCHGVSHCKSFLPSLHATTLH